MTNPSATGRTISPLSSETTAISHRSIPDIEPCDKWIRATFAGETIADTSSALILRREKRLPVYAFPKRDVQLDLMRKTREKAAFAPFGTAIYWDIDVGETTAENAAWDFHDPANGRPSLADYMVFEWGRMSAWFEEGEEVFVHLKDPYHRIDVLHSSRRVRIVAGSRTLAETTRAAFLFETGFPTRFYIPQDDVAMEYLEPGDLQTRCPYKGIASSYWSVRTGSIFLKNIVWSYADPLPEAYKIKGHLCFFNEKVDAVYLDGALVAKPDTPWS